MPAVDVMETFVGRGELLSQLVGHIRAQRGQKRPKHIFLYGPRGIGKTTMLLVLRHTIHADPGLSACTDAVQFSEEERRVVNLPSFAVRTLELLAEARPETREDLLRAKAAPQDAFAILMAAVARFAGRQVMLLLDNFDDMALAILSRKGRQLGPNARAGLEQLLTSPHFRIVATALQNPAKRKKFPRWVLEPFALVAELQPLDDPMALLRKRAAKDRREGFLEGLPRLARRVDGLNRLAEGNPRLLVFLYECLGDQPFLNLLEIVQRTIDQLTPMYQDIIDRLLNARQAAALEALAAAGGVATPKEIAEATFQDVATVRTFLADLCTLGLATKKLPVPAPAGEPDGREPRTYRTCPALFQIWYEMRHLDRGKGLFLVHFLSLLIDSGEAHQTLEELRAALDQLRASKDAQSREAEHLVDLVGDVRDALDPGWESLMQEHVYDVLRRGGTVASSLASLDALIALGEQGAAVRKVALLVVRSQVKAWLGDLGGAEADVKAAESLLPPEAHPEAKAKVLVAWSRLLALRGENDRALEKAKSAVNLCPEPTSPASRSLLASALLALASAQRGKGESRDALAAAEGAEKLGDEDELPEVKGRALVVLGTIYKSLRDPGRARDCFERSLRFQERAENQMGQATSLNELGCLHLEHGETEPARACFEKALAVQRQAGDQSGEAASLGNLGNVCQALADYSQARDYFEKALRIQERVGDKRGQAATLSGLGTVSIAVAEYMRAGGYLERALAIAQQVGDPHSEATLLNNLGKLRFMLAEFPRAREHFEKALAIGQKAGDSAGEASSLGGLGSVCLALGDYRQARGYLEKALAIETRLGNPRGQAASLSNLGNLCWMVGDYQGARQYHKQSLDITQQTGDRGAEASSLNNLGNACSALGEYSQARDYFEKALAIKRQIGDRNGEASSLGNLGSVCHSLGDYARARDCYERALVINRQVGDRSGEATSLGNLGILHASLGELVRARECFEQALVIKQEVGDRREVATLLNNLGSTCLSMDRRTEARMHFENSLAIAREIGDPRGEAASLNNLGNMHQDQGDLTQAKAHYERALAIERQIGDRNGEAGALGNLGNTCRLAGERAQARSYTDKALEIHQKIGNRSAEAMCYANLGALCADEGLIEESAEWLRKAHALFASLGERQLAQRAAGDLVGSLFRLASDAIVASDANRANRFFCAALELASEAGPDRLTEVMVNKLIAPCLRHSPGLSVRLMGLVQQAQTHGPLAGHAAVLRTVQAFVQGYTPGGSAALVNQLGPAELVLLQSMIDLVERPQHVRARQLLQAGKLGEAQRVLAAIVEKTPDDVEAVLNLASVLMEQGLLDEAEKRVRQLLSQRPEFTAGLRLLSHIEERRGHPDKAIEVLRSALARVPSQLELYPELAQVLRRQERFKELAEALTKWRDLTADTRQSEQLDVWIPEAHLLAGDTARAGACLPGEDFVPGDPNARLLLGLLRVLLALHEQNGDKARYHAARLLEFAADAPSGGITGRLSQALWSRAKELLGDRELEFFTGLAMAAGSAVDPIEFASRFLTPKETQALADRVAEEGHLALEALRSGRLQGFTDLFRTTTRSIGPAAALSALGDAYGGMSPAQKTVVLDLLLEASRRAGPAEVPAAINSLGKNFHAFGPPERAKCLAALVDLAARPDTGPASRERALRLLNVLYPNLDDAERLHVRRAVEGFPEQLKSPALAEFLGQTVPIVDQTQKP
jgi:tetratricopeptide (TPR) repeat protein